jgi:Tol biopolymer transport system component
MAYNEVSPRTSDDIWTATIESDGAGLRAGKPELFLQASADERHPAFFPDGRWLAYTSNESGKYQVYVRAQTRQSSASVASVKPRSATWNAAVTPDCPEIQRASAGGN